MTAATAGGPARLPSPRRRHARGHRERRQASTGSALLAIAAPWAVGLGLPEPAASQVMDDHVYTYIAFDELELAPGLAERPVAYDGQAWIGGDFNRVWLKARGEQATRGGGGRAEGQVLYSRSISAFWNAQGGVGVDHRYGGGSLTRGLLVLGIQGLAPYWFEMESFLFVSHEGDVSARLEAGYEVLVTQRLVLEPELEVDLALQDVPELGVGSGLGAVELAARLRYEIVRELAPYVGVTWTGRTGASADLARARGLPASEGAFVAGVRWWW